MIFVGRKEKAILVILLFFLYTTYPIILTSLGIYVPIINPENVTAGSILFQVGLDILFVLFLLFLYRDTLKSVFRDFWDNKKQYIKTIFATYGLALVCYLAINALIVGLLKVQMPNNVLQQRLLDAAPIYLAISMLICTPVIEEVAFRKSFGVLIENKWAYIVLSGLLYGVFYICLSYTEPAQLLFILSCGVFGGFLAHSYYKTQNVLVPIAIHVIHNILFLLISIS